MLGKQRRRRDLGERAVGGNGVVRRRVLEPDLAAVEPEPEAAGLAPHDHGGRGTAENDDHVAGAVAGAEQQHLGAGEARGDLDAVVAQVGGQRRAVGGAGRGHDQQGDERAGHPSAGATE